MKTLCLFLFAVVGAGFCQGSGNSPQQAGAGDHKPCIDPAASPASDEDRVAFQRILSGINSDLPVFLYVSDDPVVRQFGGAMSFRCAVDDHQLYETYESFTIYDPKLVQVDAARDFVFAHEIAHHLNGDTSSGQRSERIELRADYNGAKYLLRLGWKEARILRAVDLLDLPQGTAEGYPTAAQRRKNVEDALRPGPPAAPMNLQAMVVGLTPRDVTGQLVNLQFSGAVKFESARTSRYVCARGTPDARLPSTLHFEFFDTCEEGARVQFYLETTPDKSGYWFEQRENPCPEFAENCNYVLKAVGSKLQFWNENLGADYSEWRKELGEEEIFSVEAADSSKGTVRIKLHAGGYIVVDGPTGKLQGGGSREQAAEFTPVPGELE